MCMIFMVAIQLLQRENTAGILIISRFAYALRLIICFIVYKRKSTMLKTH